MVIGTLRDKIAQELRERILTGSLDAGMHLDLDRLAVDFGASRTPVREAMLLLARDGLVEFNPRQSSVVIGIGADDIRDIYMVFGALQGLAAAAVARHVDEQLIARLEHLAAAVEVVAMDNPAEMERRNEQFHRAINTSCDSRMLQNHLRQLSALVPRSYFAMFPDQYRLGMVEHWDIIGALRDGSSEDARRIAEGHFIKAGERLFRHMGRGGNIKAAESDHSSQEESDAH